MREKILARLKAKYSGVNLSKTRLDAIADKLAAKITDENEIDAKLDELNDIMSFAEIAKQDDRLRTLENKSKEKPPPPKPGSSDENEDTPEKKGNGDDTPAWAKTLMAEVQGLKKEKAETTIRGKLAEKLKDKVPEKFWSKRMIPEKDEDIETFVADAEKDWTELKQDKNNEGLGGSSAPPASGGGSNATAKQVEEDIKAWAVKEAPKKTEAVK
jgi:hypothetical protein